MLIPQVQKFALIFFSRPEIYSEEGGGKSFESCCPCSQSVRLPPSHRGERRCRHTLIKRKKSHHPLSFSKKKKKSLKPFRPRGEDVSSNFARRKKERGIEASFDRFSARQDDGLEGKKRDGRSIALLVLPRALSPNYSNLPPRMPYCISNQHTFYHQDYSRLFSLLFICLGGEIITLSLLFQGLIGSTLRASVEHRRQKLQI